MNISEQSTLSKVKKRVQTNHVNTNSFSTPPTVKRLYRYRNKYYAERAAVDRMQEEVDEMEQFGGQAGIPDHLVITPLL